MLLSQRSLSPRQLLVILTGLNLLNYLDRYIVAAIIPHIKAEMQLSDGQLGRISTIFMVGYFLSSPFFGYLGDRGSRKWLIATGIFVWSLATVFSGLATSLMGLLLCRLFVGLGEASYATISPSLISDTHPKEKRTNAFTWFYMAIPVGSALGYLVGGLVSSAYGWREAFLWAGAPGLLLALTLLPFREPQRGEVDGAKAEFQQKPTVKDIWALFKIKEFNLLVWGYTFYTFALGAYAYWGPTFMIRAHGMAANEASTFFGAIMVVTGLLGTLIGGFGATKLQKRVPTGLAWTLGLSVLIAAPITFFSFEVESALLSKVLLCFAMFLLFMSTGPINALLIEVVPVNRRASSVALSIFMIHFFGDMWSPEIVGRLSDHFGNLRTALYILPAALVVSAGFWLAFLKDRETHRQHALAHP